MGREGGATDLRTFDHDLRELDFVVLHVFVLHLHLSLAWKWIMLRATPIDLREISILERFAQVRFLTRHQRKFWLKKTFSFSSFSFLQGEVGI